MTTPEEMSSGEKGSQEQVPKSEERDAISIEFATVPKHKHDLIQPEGDLIQSDDDDAINDKSLSSFESSIDLEVNKRKTNNNLSTLRKRAYLSWYDVSFFIPYHFTMMERLTGKARLQNVGDGSISKFDAETDELNGLPKQSLVCKSGTIYRQIVTS